jgi:hypothetical protein
VTASARFGSAACRQIRAERRAGATIIALAKKHACGISTIMAVVHSLSPYGTKKAKK